TTGDRATVVAAGVIVDGVAIVATFVLTLHAVTANVDLAGTCQAANRSSIIAQASVVRVVVAIVALFTGLEDAVTTGGHITAVRAGIVVDGVAVIALLGSCRGCDSAATHVEHVLDAVAARRKLAGIDAAIVGIVVAVIALLER